jgi:hypothetical protein
MAQQRVNGVNLYDEDRGDGAPIVLIHGRRRSRVRENRMARFDEAAGGIRHQSGSYMPHGVGASRRPYRHGVALETACSSGRSRSRSWARRLSHPLTERASGDRPRLSHPLVLCASQWRRS